LYDICKFRYYAVLRLKPEIMTEHLYFAHANSFPASVYQKMLSALADHYTIAHLDTIGHNPAFPVTDCWPFLVQEAIQEIERQTPGPVYGVGHSLGGVLMLYAALARPELFKGLVILDAPFFGAWRARSIWLAKKLRFIDRLTPGGNTLKRRDCWASVEMAHDYFLRKPQFARFDRDCLRDYAEHGTRDDGQGNRRLKFRPVIEHAIYCSLPHDLARASGHMRTPGVFLSAEQGGVLNEADLRFVKNELGMQVARQPGTHLFPLEHPLDTAARIHESIEQMTRPTPVSCSALCPETQSD
jgi:pimeloyl-ACP methyl ester carboxylesterase